MVGSMMMVLPGARAVVEDVWAIAVDVTENNMATRRRGDILRRVCVCICVGNGVDGGGGIECMIE